MSDYVDLSLPPQVESVPGHADAVSPAPLPCPTLRFHSIDLTCNRARFYLVSIQRTLWNEWAVVRTFGRIGTAGCQQATVHGSAAEARGAYDREVARRSERLYSLVGTFQLPD